MEPVNRSYEIDDYFLLEADLPGVKLANIIIEVEKSDLGPARLPHHRANYASWIVSHDGAFIGTFAAADEAAHVCR